MIKAINFGCGFNKIQNKKCVIWFNVDKPNINLDNLLPYKTDEFDFGVCECVVPYLKDVIFSVSEMRRVCKVLDVQFPHHIGSPSSLVWGRVYNQGYTIRELMFFKPVKVTVQLYNYIFFKRFSFKPEQSFLKSLAFYYDIYLSSFIRCRGIWLRFKK